MGKVDIAGTIRTLATLVRLHEGNLDTEVNALLDRAEACAVAADDLTFSHARLLAMCEKSGHPITAELIAADREYDEARREYDAKAPDGLGEMDSRTAADYARLNAATARRASALAALEPQP